MAPASIPARVLDRAARAWLRSDAADPARQDSTTGYSGAAVSNALSGLGGSRDSGATARPNMEREYLTEDELIALMRGSVYRRIIELHPRWATMRGFTITDNTTEVKPLHTELRRLKVRDAIRQADTWGRALGEARILLVTDDMEQLDRPLDVAKVRQLHRLEVLDRREFTPVRYQSDVSQSELGEPDVYQVTPRRPGVGFQGPVHASRLLRFHGDELPPSERGYTWTWGADAVGQTLWDGVRHLAQAGASGAKAGQELSIGVFKLANASAKSAGDERVSFLDKLRALNMMKSIANAVFLTPNDSYERVNINASGFKDISDHARLELALLTGIPLALLFGEAPAGLSTDGASWQAAWHATIAAHQEERYRDPIETIIRILYQVQQGGTPNQWSMEFEPLGQLSATEKATIRLTQTQADSTAILDGVITADEARKRYTQPGGWAAELQVLPEREARQIPAVDPAAEAEAERMVREAMERAGKPPAEAVKPAAQAPAVETDPEALLPDEVEPLNGAQITAAQGILASVVVGELTAEAARLLLEGIVPPARARALVAAMKGAKAPAEAPAADRIDATEGAIWIGCSLPESARAAWAAARLAVEAITGPIDDPGDDPHVTVLYMGQVPPESVAEVVEVARIVTQRLEPAEAEAERARVFEPGPSSEGKWPVVLDVGKAWGLWEVNQQLTRRLAHLITARQFPEFRAHLTLGYAADLSPEQQAAIAELELPEAEWMIGGLEVRLGAATLATLPLAGRRDGKR